VIRVSGHTDWSAYQLGQFWFQRFMQRVVADVRGVSLIVVGSSTIDDVLRASPQLKSRMARPVKFEPIAPVDLPKVLAMYHPMFDGCDSHVIGRLDAAFAHRNFRRWARILQSANRFAPVFNHEGPLNAEMSERILAELVVRRR